MHPKASFHFALNRIFAAFVVVVLSAVCAWPASYKVLFNGNRFASHPSSGLITDAAGNAYGTTAGGGHDNAGTVYELSPTTGPHLLYAFSGPDGRQPQGNLVFDSAGNLYGTAVYGGANKAGCNNRGCGVVFKLTPSSNGGLWTETVLYSFCSAANCADGANPQAGVILDSAGNLYGTTEFGGTLGLGTVFAVTPGQGGGWTETVIYDVIEGWNPVGGLVFDGAGNLFGTTLLEGPQKGGTVFELSPGPGGIWTYTLLYAFDGFNGSQDAVGPGAGLIFDSAGSLYGTAEAGGEFGFGAVFELTPNSGSWTESVLYSFAGGNDGATPMASPVLDSAGRLYGTTFAGGGTSCGCGTVFKLTPGLDGQWTETLFRFPQNGSLGDRPSAPVLLDPLGNVYGTTTAGGRSGNGVVFRITP